MSAEVPSTESLQRAYLELRTDVRRFVARRAPTEAVDDLTQEVFLRLHEHATELRDTARVGPWAFRIARNVVTDHFRTRRAHAPLEAAAEPALEEPSENMNDQVGAWFKSMLAMLPEEYRVALELTDVEGLSQRDLATRLGLSFSGARSRVQRARKMLEELFRACCHFELDSRGNVIACAPRRGSGCERC